MNDLWGKDAARVLTAIGFTREDLTTGDHASWLRATRELPGSSLHGISESELRSAAALTSAYAQIQVRTDDSVDVDLSEVDAAGKLKALESERAYLLYVHFDKERWAQAVFPDSQVSWFLTAEAASHALARGLYQHSEWLFPNPSRRALLLVTEADIALSGPFLDVRGGSNLFDPPVTGDPVEHASARLARRMGEYSRASARWPGTSEPRITPEHLALQGNGWETEVGQQLFSNLVLLALLYMSDRAHSSRDGRLSTEFLERDRLVVLQLEPSPSPPAITTPPYATFRAALLVSRLLRWCYEEEPADADRCWIEDRLQVVQTLIVDLLHGVDPSRRTDLFVASLPWIVEDAKHRWKAFLSTYVIEYARQRLDLLKAVEDTVQRIADRTAAITKAVIDAMMAAMAVGVGLFVASALGEEFNAQLFSLGLYVYAAYVLCFPAGFGLLSELARYRAIADVEGHQLAHMESILGFDGTVELWGLTLVNAKERFLWSFRAAVIAYGVVIVGAIMAARVVPGFVEP